jgi:hypothetical protein
MRHGIPYLIYMVCLKRTTEYDRLIGEIVRSSFCAIMGKV